MSRTLHSFTVNGCGEFPFDLLWREKAWPASYDDSVALRPADCLCRSVRLQTIAWKAWTPDIDRWQSRHWRVLIHVAT